MGSTIMRELEGWLLWRVKTAEKVSPLLTLTGVEDVSGFDEQTINVRLSEMTLVVKGTGLHISKLNLESGDVVIDGSISSLQYLGSSSGSLRSRLFR